MAVPASPKKPAKNKPKFFSVLLTAVFVAAGVFGVYKICTYIESNPLPAFLNGGSQTTTAAASSKTTEPTTEEADNSEARAVADALGKADSTLTAEMLNYCAANFDAAALQKALDAATDKSYDREVWYTATGYSIHAIRALADGSLKATQTEPKDTIEIGFVGKVNFGGASSNMVTYGKDGKLASCIDSNLLQMMNGMDIQVANNEFTFSADSSTAEYKADAKTAELYKEMGVDVVTLANTHIYDYGKDGLTATVSALDKAGIAHVGAGADLTEASKPAYFLAGGRKIAIIGAGDSVYWKSVKAATGSSAGVLSLRDSMDAVKTAVKSAKQESDFVFVYMSAGLDENALWFDSDQSTWANAMIDAGADSVIGSHSSKLQGMQYYNGKLIAYGLGSFWCDGKSLDSAMLKLSIAKDGTVTATAIACGQADGKTSLYADAAKTNTFDHICKYCGNVVTISQDGTITRTR